MTARPLLTFGIVVSILMGGILMGFTAAILLNAWAMQ